MTRQSVPSCSPLSILKSKNSNEQTTNFDESTQRTFHVKTMNCYWDRLDKTSHFVFLQKRKNQFRLCSKELPVLLGCSIPFPIPCFLNRPFSLLWSSILFRICFFWKIKEALSIINKHKITFFLNSLKTNYNIFIFFFGNFLLFPDFLFLSPKDGDSFLHKTSVPNNKRPFEIFFKYRIFPAFYTLSFLDFLSKVMVKKLEKPFGNLNLSDMFQESNFFHWPNHFPLPSTGMRCEFSQDLDNRIEGLIFPFRSDIILSLKL